MLLKVSIFGMDFFSFQSPISVEQSKMYVGRTEPLSMSMELPVHVPGQTIPIKVVTTNSTIVVVTKIRVVCKKVTLLLYNCS